MSHFTYRPKHFSHRAALAIKAARVRLAALVAILGLLSQVLSVIAFPPLSANAANTSASKLAQQRFIFENDDGGVDTSTQHAAGNTAITSVKKNERLNLRMQLDNTGTALNSNLGLFYDRNDGKWTKVRSGTAPVNSAGSCVSTDFTCTTVDSTGIVGQYTSTAVDSSGKLRATRGSATMDALNADPSYRKAAPTADSTLEAEPLCQPRRQCRQG